MKFGAGFALTAQADPIALRDMAQTLDGEGFDYVTTAGHLLCAPPDSSPGRPLPTYVGPFREPFVFFAYLAAVTQRLAFRTSILILPLFPTALVAKQGAELSLLSGGRFQLGANTGAGGLALYQPAAADDPIAFIADQDNHRVERFTLNQLSSGDPTNLLYLVPEVDNIRAAMGFSLDRGDVEAGARLVHATRVHSRLAPDCCCQGVLRRE